MVSNSRSSPVRLISEGREGKVVKAVILPGKVEA